MDIVLEKIHYGFEDYIKRTEPGVFQKAFDDLKKAASFPEEYLISDLGVKKQPRALLE